MQVHFRNRMFDYNKALKIIAIIMLYYFISIFPYISGYHIHTVLKIDIEQLTCSFHEMIFLLTLFSVGVSIVESTLFTKFLIGVNPIEIFDDDYMITFLRDHEVEYRESLDISNPFLYSFKTKGLLE